MSRRSIIIEVEKAGLSHYTPYKVDKHGKLKSKVGQSVVADAAMTDVEAVEQLHVQASSDLEPSTITQSLPTSAEPVEPTQTTQLPDSANDAAARRAARRAAREKEKPVELVFLFRECDD